MNTRQAAFVLLLASSPLAVVATPPEEPRLFRMDAVELVAGRDTPGVEAHAMDRGGFRYLFATAENKAAFERDPEKYEIQFGGSCARMGPLSGACSTEFYAVHDGKLYVFASQQCRASFLKAPQKMLETDDEPAAGDDASKARARELLELAVQFVGGAEKLDAVRAYRQRIETTGEHQGKPTRETSSFTAVFPDCFRFDDTWNDSYWGHAIAADSGFLFAKGDAERMMVNSQVQSVRRDAHHNLLVTLKARTQPGFAAAALGEQKVGDAKAERVAVSFKGTTTMLDIEPKTGQIMRITHTGRGPRGTIGLIEKTFTEFRQVDGLRLPAAWRVTFDGDEAGAKTTTLAAIEIDPAVDAAQFKPTGQ